MTISARTTSFQVGVAPVTIVTNTLTTRTMVNLLNISNITGAAVTATVSFFDNSAAATRRLMQISIPANATMALGSQATVPNLFLEQNDSISVVSSAAASLDVVCSVIDGV